MSYHHGKYGRLIRADAVLQIGMREIDGALVVFTADGTPEPDALVRPDSQDPPLPRDFPFKLLTALDDVVGRADRTVLLTAHVDEGKQWVWAEMALPQLD